MNAPESMRHTVGELRRINACCEEFESAWRSHDAPLIEVFLEKSGFRDDNELFAELLGIELEYRRRAGEQPTPDEYLGRFATRAGLVEDAFGDGTVETVVCTRTGASATTVSAADNVSDDQARMHQLGDYDLLDLVGRGGRGVVYRAQHRETGRVAAVKVIRDDQLAELDNEQLQVAHERFANEIRAVAQLEHDHIVTLFDVGQVAGQQYYAMQFVDGPSLAGLMKHGPLRNEDAARYVSQAARAVHEAHLQGIIHRDLKPHNILLSERHDRALVADFGLAKLSDHPALTATGDVFGSPPYMSPEQASDAGNAGVRSDVYSLGATLYQLLNGRPPFQAATSVATLLQVMHDTPPPLRTLNADVDRDLETICAKCLQKDPRQRYASAAELADDLDRYLDGQPIMARPLGPLHHTVRWCRRNPLPAGLVATIALLLCTGIIVSAALAWEARQQSRRANQAASDARRSEQAAKESAAKALRQTAKAEAQRLRADQMRDAAVQRNKLARTSIVNQLRLYVRPCRIAGEVAVANDSNAALAVLNRLARDEPTIMNRELAVAANSLRAELERAGDTLADAPLDERQQHPVNQAAIRLATVCRDSWAATCDADFGSRARGSKPKLPTMDASEFPSELGGITIKSIEQELIVDQIYRDAVEATSAIADASDWESSQDHRLRFWKLFYGEMVFFETEAVERVMVEFGKELSRWSQGTARKELKLTALSAKLRELIMPATP